MGTFLEYLEEHVLSIGLNPDHEKHREEYRDQIHDILRNSYKSIGGYGALGSGSDAESKAIHDDISKSLIKATRRDGKITTVNLYRDQHGRKSIAAGTNGTPEGKADYKKNKIDDNLQKRAWGEVSGATEHIANKLGVPKIPADTAEKIINKPILSKDPDGYHYRRLIGAEEKQKIAVGHTTYKKH